MSERLIIKTFEELKSKMSQLFGEYYIYRGTSNPSQILPQIVRNGYEKHEFEILKDFERYYGIYENVNSCWELVALAQHHELMTRLIDFTTNPYVALFFALHPKPDDETTYQLFCIKKENTIELLDQDFSHFDYDTSEGTMKIFEKSQKEIYSSEFEYFAKQLEKKNLGKIVTIQPNIGNSRLLMQQGLFVFPLILDKDYINKEINENSLIIEIDKSVREEALGLLDKLGYNEYRLMPDLVSVCKEINSKYKK